MGRALLGHVNCIYELRAGYDKIAEAAHCGLVHHRIGYLLGGVLHQIVVYAGVGLILASLQVNGLNYIRLG